MMRLERYNADKSNELDHHYIVRPTGGLQQIVISVVLSLQGLSSQDLKGFELAIQLTHDFPDIADVFFVCSFSMVRVRVLLVLESLFSVFLFIFFLLRLSSCN